jgi:hypothetical protein
MPQIASFVVKGFFAIALVGSPETAVAQGQNLPPCPGNPNLVWDDCFGTYLYANGNKYVGEWRDDKRNGQGTYTFPNGGEYVGEFRDNMRTGQSTFTYADGDTYVGEFRLGFRHGEGTLMSANGTVIRQGLWLNGDPVNGE